MHYDTVALLDRYARREGLPMVGASIGLMDDRSTWSIQFSDDATQSDRDKEAATIQSFDEAAEMALAHEDTIDAQLDEPVVSALIEVLASETSYTADELRGLMKDQLADT